MVKVVANMYIGAENVEKFLELGKVVVEKTNALDKGCIRYELCRDKNDPEHFAMIEEWESMEALDAHMKSAHFGELIPQMDALGSKQGGIGLFDKVF